MGRWKHIINIVILTVVLSTLSVSFGQEYGSERYFKYAIQPKASLAIPNLIRQLPYRIEYLVELNNPVERKPIGDTLMVWFQHVPEEGKFILPRMIMEFDMIVTCYPERLPMRIRQRHALKNDTGVVHLLQFWKERLLVVYARNNKSESVKRYERKFEKITGTHPDDFR